MRIVLQRVSRASVRVDGDVVSAIERGLVLLVGIGADDRDDEVERLSRKVFDLRVFEDAQGKTNLSLSDVGGEVLVVSQFTLYGDVQKGRRPSWSAAAPPEVAEPKVEAFARALESLGATVRRGVFGAHMQVELDNDGPVTLVIDGERL